MSSEKAHRLTQVFQQITKRYNSIFFTKLFLLEDQHAPIEGHIRHYDIECEAATNLVGILQTKIKANILKAFYLIKNYEEARSFSRKNLSNSKSKTNVQLLRYEPRAFGNTLSTSNMRSRSYLRSGSFKSSRATEGKLQFNSFDMDNSIYAIMSKVQTLGMKMQKRQRTQNNQNQPNISRIQKRQVIMSKLTQLENHLSSYLEEQNQQQQRPTQSVTINNLAAPNTNKPPIRTGTFSRQVGFVRNL